MNLIETVSCYDFDLFIFLPVDQGKITLEELTQEDHLEESLSENYSLVSQHENSKFSVSLIVTQF